MYGDVVFDLGKQPFAEVQDEFKRRRNVERTSICRPTT